MPAPTAAGSALSATAAEVNRMLCTWTARFGTVVLSDSEKAILAAKLRQAQTELDTLKRQAMELGAVL